VNAERRSSLALNTIMTGGSTLTPGFDERFSAAI